MPADDRTAIAWPAEAAPSPGQPPGPVMPPPGFRALPSPGPGPANPDPPAAPPGPLPGQEWAEATGADRAAPSTRTSTDSPRAAFRGRARTFTKLAETAFQAIGGLLNKALATDEDDGCFLPDDDDLHTVPPPIGRLAARRVELPVDGENLSDAEDLIAAAIAVGAWALKGVVDWAQARRAARRAAAGAVVLPAEPGEPQQ